MDLFERVDKEPRNLLPHDGVVQYYGPVMAQGDADRYLAALQTDIDWRPDEAVMFGKRIITKRHVAWYGDAAFPYRYSKTTKTALPWVPVLEALKEVAERVSGATYNSCLLNLYHDGGEGMAWHSDAEKELKRGGAIASFSFGAVRKFSFKHRATKTSISQILEHGSLLVMKGETQQHWLHQLPKAKAVQTVRINLTFRTIDRNV